MQANTTTLHLTSMYFHDPKLLRMHTLRLTMAVDPAQPEILGMLFYDPNTCGLDVWGDRAGCTRMGLVRREFRATRTRTADPLALDRRHYAVQLAGEPDREMHLIEHPKANLWYLVVCDDEQGRHVVPLFQTALFAHPDAKIDTVPIPE